ncbi:MAG: septum formation initiator family protein [Candidatus Marinimicrobia bacterium]|nr:septum formation initiator family protein [Candidatus Neomarinimicrobiota bacterium]
MLNQKDNGIHPKLSIRIIIIALIIAFASIFFGDSGLLSYLQLKREVQSIKNRKNEYEELELKLLEEKDKLQNDSKYLEKIAREKYRMAKKNETIYRVIKKDSRKKKK